MSVKIDHQVQDSKVQPLDALHCAEMPYHCIDCGWKGTKSQLGQWLGFSFWVGFSGPRRFCPKCGHSGFLVSDEELDEMNREDDTCKLQHPLSCHSNS